jgi:hypothetical protein
MAAAPIAATAAVLATIAPIDGLPAVGRFPRNSATARCGDTASSVHKRTTLLLE